MLDPLATFRPKGKAQTALDTSTAKEAEGLPAYLAFDAKDRIKYLQIRTARGVNRAPAYAYLLDVISDGDRGTEISLLFSFMVVDIRGKNLQGVTHSLMSRGCAYIQDFNEKLFTLPKPSEPIIYEIEIVVKDKD